MKFQREALTTALHDEMRPLLDAHWQEISHYLDIPLDPDPSVYEAVQANGALRVYTVRDERGVDVNQNHSRLIGYAIFFVRHNAHYKSSLQASQDILFLHPDFRGGFVGYRFIEWCDDQLREEGVQVVYHHVKQKHNFGPMLEHMNYELIDLIYGRRLDRGK